MPHMPPADASAHYGVLLHSGRHLLIAKIGSLPSPGLREHLVVRALLCSGLHDKRVLDVRLYKSYRDYSLAWLH